MTRKRPSRHTRRYISGKRAKVNQHIIPPRKKLVGLISKMHPEINQSNASHLVDMTFEGITDSMRHGKEFAQPGFGKFIVKHRKARKGRNPFTGKTIQIKAKKVIKFRPAQQLKKAVL